MSLATARNVLIVLAIAALVVLVPGGGRGANVAIQAVSLVFLASFVWVGFILYRQHRSTLYELGDRRRAIDRRAAPPPRRGGGPVGPGRRTEQATAGAQAS